MVAMGGPVGWIHSACQERLTCHLGILRLMTWGFERRRRMGLSRWRRWTMARRQVASVASVSRGGKSAALGDGTAGDA
jgi:hypothetical protein